MEQLIRRFTEQLQEQLGKATVEEKLSNGIYKVSVDHDVLHIYVYPHHVANRLYVLDGTIKTIHLDQDILTHEFAKVIARIKVVIGMGRRIHARSTVVARIDKKTAMEFQEEHHLQAALPGKYRYGLYDQGELISIAVFSGGRKMKNKPDDYRSFELLRFCHKRDIITIGGISKLIRAFCKDFKPGDIMTYVDRDWSQDSTLKTIGFLPEKTTEPQTFTIVSGQRILYNTATVDFIPPRDTYQKRNSGSVKMVFSLYYPD